MKRAFIFFCFSVLIFWFVSKAHAVEIHDPWTLSDSEMNLCDIWNNVLNDNYTGSSQDLFNEYGIGLYDETGDAWWFETNGGIDLDIRYAGYNQTFGYMTADGNKTILAENISPGIHEDLNITFGIGHELLFAWFEQWNEQGYWYSDSTLNSDGNDHFVAFEVPVEFYAAFDNPYDGNHRLFMLAFEDLSMGDRDYNDLVVFVNAVAPAPVPEPATMVLLGIGLIGLGGLRRKLIN